MFSKIRMIPRFRYRLSVKDIVSACIQWLLHRNQNERFKEALLSFLGVRSGWLTFNGRIALWLALKALNKIGTEVIVPGYLCPVVAKTVKDAGYKICIVDSDLETLSIDRHSFINSINDETSAVIVAHIAGMPVDITEIRVICKRCDIVVIEDCAQGFGAKIQGKFVGTEADMAIYSFGIGKELNTGGGLLIADDKWTDEIDKIYQLFVCPTFWKACIRFTYVIAFKLISYPIFYRFIVPSVDKKVDESKHTSQIYPMKNDRFSSALGILQLRHFPGFLRKRRTNVMLWQKSLYHLHQYIRWLRVEKNSEPTFLRMVFFLLPKENISS